MLFVKTVENIMTSKPIIEINGIIGIDTTYDAVIQQLKECRGDLEVHIDSPGGYVYSGIAIYNALRNYQGGKVEIIVYGLSASMASYIMLAGDSLSLCSNAVVMIHNPSTLINGDHRELQKGYQLNLRLRRLMVLAYAQHLHQDVAVVESLLDNETYYIGQEELQVWGQVLTSERPPIDRDTAQLQIQTTLAVMQQQPEADAQLVAYLPNFTNNHQDLPMETLNNLTDFKTKYPQLYAQALEEGRNKERSRVMAHLQFLNIDRDTALTAIETGEAYADNELLQAKYNRAKLNQAEIAEMVANNPPMVMQAPIDEAKELQKEQTQANLEQEQQIKAFMPHLSTKN